MKTAKALTDEDVEAMVDAAFIELARRHPEAYSGDYPPNELYALQQVMRKHAEYWLHLNAWVR
jgi:hypothetical protein